MFKQYYRAHYDIIGQRGAIIFLIQEFQETWEGAEILTNTQCWLNLIPMKIDVIFSVILKQFKWVLWISTWSFCWDGSKED